MMGRKLVATEQADLHLVWYDDNFFVKPLPDYLLSHRFWTANICSHDDLYADACGFLMTYVWLVRNKIDFELAKSSSLLPDGLTWPIWAKFVHDVASKVDLERPSPISKRYKYGELRLARLDQIYRLSPKFHFKYLLQGYLYAYSSYSGFFRREFAWLVVAFAYISIILSAMQVGLATSQLKDDALFNNGSFGFAVSAIIFPVAMTGVAVLLYACLWVFHLTTTLYYHMRAMRQEENEGRRQATQQKQEKQRP